MFGSRRRCLDRKRERDIYRGRERQRDREKDVEGLVVLVEGKGEVGEVWGREAQQVPLNY